MGLSRHILLIRKKPALSSAIRKIESFAWLGYDRYCTMCLSTVATQMVQVPFRRALTCICYPNPVMWVITSELQCSTRSSDPQVPCTHVDIYIYIYIYIANHVSLKYIPIVSIVIPFFG